MSLRRSRRARRQSPQPKRLRCESLESRQLLTVTFTVNSTGDEDLAHVSSGTVTLRSAIEQANLDTSTDDIEIDFSISGSGPFVIHPGGDTNHSGVPLPVITRNKVTIDGQSQSGIVIDGSQAASGSEGLVINASNCVIVGLAIQDFTGTGVEIASTLTSVAKDNRVEDNVITNNGVGVTIDDTASDDLDRIVLGENGEFDVGQLIDASDATGNEILGNTITGNTSRGVLIAYASQNIVDDNLITGTTAGPGLEIQGTGDALMRNEKNGDGLTEEVTVHNDATRNAITSNTITENHGDGVLVYGGSFNSIGDDEGHGNVISGNVGNGTTTGNGVVITGTATLGPGTTSDPETFSALASSSAAEALFSQVVQTWHLPVAGAQAVAAAGLPPIVYTVQWIGDVPTLNLIQGNFIGTDATGRVVDGNALDGILIDTAARIALIGDLDLQTSPGELTAAANVIGGNRNGITIRGAALYNDPIDEAQAEDDTVGGAYYGNHIAAIGGSPGTFEMDDQDFENNASIFEFLPTIVFGNSIGVFSDSEGDYAIGNTEDGLLIDHSRAFASFNTISANGASGIHITGTPQSAFITDTGEETLYARSYIDSIVSGNKIGTDITGLVLEDGSEESLGNGGHGVFIENGAQYNVIGPTAQDNVDPYETVQALRNIISNNGGWGVYVHGMGAFHFEGTPSAQFSE